MIEYLKLIFGYLDVPAIVLGFMLLACYVIVRKAYKSGEVSFADMLEDDSGKASVTRLGSLVALVFSSWFIMYDSIHNQQGDPTVLLIYLAVWSGAKVAERFVDALSTKWSK